MGIRVAGRDVDTNYRGLRTYGRFSGWHLPYQEREVYDLYEQGRMVASIRRDAVNTQWLCRVGIRTRTLDNLGDAMLYAEALRALEEGWDD
jgi:hypothetical protein